MKVSWCVSQTCIAVFKLHRDERKMLSLLFDYFCICVTQKVTVKMETFHGSGLHKKKPLMANIEEETSKFWVLENWVHGQIGGISNTETCPHGWQPLSGCGLPHMWRDYLTARQEWHLWKLFLLLLDCRGDNNESKWLSMSTLLFCTVYPCVCNLSTSGMRIQLQRRITLDMLFRHTSYT